MARHRRRRRRGMGSIITVRPVNGLRGRGFGRGVRGFGRGLGRGFGSLMSALMPALMGIGIPAGVILATRGLVNPAQSRTHALLVRFAPVLGFGAGAVASLAAGMLGSREGGWGSIAASGVTSGAFIGYDMIQKSPGRAAAIIASLDVPLMPSSTPTDAGATPTAGMIVANRVNGLRGLGKGTGAIVFDKRAPGPALGKPGQVINLGSVNPRVFGKAAY